MAHVSLGIPVYNGENYLEETIRSVLSQQYNDYELVISDNASTDRTAAISKDYAASDGRIKYFRNPKNLGAAPNYNRVFEESSGQYFKWLSHDDLLLPNYISTTLKVIEADPGLVLCNTIVDYIDSQNDHLGFYKSVLSETNIDDAGERFMIMILRSHTCVDFFGLIRRSAMQNSLLHQSFSGADKAFLAQMALRGRMLQINEPLLQMREHDARYTRSTKTSTSKLAWHDTSLDGKRDIPVLKLFRTYKALVDQEVLSNEERRTCQRALRKFWLCSWNGPRLLADLVSVPFPRVVNLAVAAKLRVFGGEGNFIGKSR